LTPDIFDTILGFIGKCVRDVARLTPLNRTIHHGLKGLLRLQQERHAWLDGQL